MPRAPRVFVDGGVYHVYNRVTRGERAFEDGGEAHRFVEVVREVKQRDGLVVLAWCLMSNHYHLALRCTTVPLWRSLATVHLKLARAYNAHSRVHGPFWQGRYKAKLVERPDYLRQLILYVHLNPVSAGIVRRAEDFAWSGQREVVGRLRQPLVDADQLLLAFGDTRRAALHSYREAIAASATSPWAAAIPGALPWWQLGRPSEDDRDDALRVDEVTSLVDQLGRSTARERPPVGAVDFARRAAAALGVEASVLAGRSKRPEVVRAREIVLTLAVERYGLRVAELASALGVRYDSASLWGRRGAKRRGEDDAFRRRLDEVDAAVATAAAASGG